MDPLARLIGDITRIAAKLEDEASIECGLKSRKYIKPVLCLEAIRSLERPNFRELLENLPVKISKPSLSVAVDKLIERGYVQKTRSETDRRVFHLELTPKGHGVFDAFHQTFSAYADQLRKFLTPQEQAELAVIMGKIVKEHEFKFKDGLEYGESC